MMSEIIFDTHCHFVFPLIMVNSIYGINAKKEGRYTKNASFFVAKSRSLLFVHHYLNMLQYCHIIARCGSLFLYSYIVLLPAPHRIHKPPLHLSSTERFRAVLVEPKASGAKPAAQLHSAQFASHKYLQQRKLKLMFALCLSPFHARNVVYIYVYIRVVSNRRKNISACVVHADQMFGLML